MHKIILCRSMTNAQRAAAVLRRAGIFASVTKAPHSANPGGCVYAVKVGERNLSKALNELRRAGIPYGAVFTLLPDGSVRRAEA